MTASNAQPISLPADQLELLRHVGRQQSFASGATIFSEGAPSHSAIVIDEGTVKLTAVTENGHVSALALRGAGDMIGEFGCIDGTTRSASVVALTDVKATIIPASRLQQLLEKRPDILFTLLKVIIARLHESDRRRLELSIYSGFELVVKVLIEHAERYGEQVDGNRRSRHLHASQRDLASFAGVSRETVQRTEHDLTKNKMITRAKGRTGRIVIHDLDLLRAIVARRQP